MRTITAVALLTVLLLFLGACSDQRESTAEQYLRQAITDQSRGALALTSFSKTNGYEQDLLGMKLYVLEWQAHIEVQVDIWKESIPLTDFYWSSFSVMLTPPSVEDRAWARFGGRSSQEFVTGATVVLTGESQLQMTDNGWRALDYEIKTSLSLDNEELLRQREQVRATEARAAEARQRRLDSWLVGEWRFSNSTVTFSADGTKIDIYDEGHTTRSHWEIERGVLTETEIEVTRSTGREVVDRTPKSMYIIEITPRTLVLATIDIETFDRSDDSVGPVARATRIP